MIAGTRHARRPPPRQEVTMQRFARQTAHLLVIVMASAGLAAGCGSSSSNGSGTGGAVATGGTATTGTGGAGGGAGRSATGGMTGGGGASPSAGCGMSPPASMRYSIDVSGMTREYILSVPSNYDPNHPYVLIFAWHPWGGSAQQVAGTGNSGYYGLNVDFAYPA
jgi:polyhydroxybutyrate depolymerase